MKSSVREILIHFVLLLIIPAAGAQFAPAEGYAGSTAIPKDTSLFVEWATACNVQRGYMDIAVPDSGYASVGDGNSAIGAAGQNGVVSLGDGGLATLTFANPIYNGPGFDFAVFENGFYTTNPLAFLEFAFVEVSSDGTNFFRFPATSNIQDSTQIPMTGVDCSLVNNLAGKYVFGYGTPFDLEELKNEVGLDVNHITHVRLIDVVGSVNSQYATYDQYGHKINDPYPTAFASGGFDLDAVGVIHAVEVSSVEHLQVSEAKFGVYPSPCLRDVECNIKVDEALIGSKLKVFDVSGRSINEVCITSRHSQLETRNYPAGLYFISVGNYTTKLIIE
jgi:hypothetical protein